MPNRPSSPSPASPTPSEQLDTYTHALLARKSGSLSPVSSLLAWQDWAEHLAASQGKHMDLAHLATSQAQALAAYVQERLLAAPDKAQALVAPPVQDRRFAGDGWRQWPFWLWQQSFSIMTPFGASRCW